MEYCQPGSECLDWVGSLVNMWRDTSDIQANWDKVLYNADENIKEVDYLKPAQFPDPDMLEVGQIGLDYDEQKSHMSLWVVMTAPLLISADPSRMDPEVLALLTNDEALAINQDANVVMGTLRSPSNATGTEVWSKPLHDGSVAVLLLNRGEVPADITADWSLVGLPSGSSADVRDVWAQKDIGSHTGSYTGSAVPRHGCELLRITPSKETAFQL